MSKWDPAYLDRKIAPWVKTGPTDTELLAASLGSSHSEAVSGPQEPPETDLTPAALRARVRGLHRALGSDLPESDFDWDMDELSPTFRSIWYGNVMGGEWTSDAAIRLLRRRTDYNPAATWPRRDPFKGLSDLLALDTRVTRVPELHV